MKKILSILIMIALAGNAYSKSDVSTLNEEQIKAMLTHKWKLKSIEAKGKKKEMPAGAPQIILHFFENGQMEEMVGDDLYKGTWTYTHSKFTVTTKDKDGVEKHTILDISGDLLKMTTKFMGIAVNYIMSRVDK